MAEEKAVQHGKEITQPVTGSAAASEPVVGPVVEVYPDETVDPTGAEPTMPGRYLDSPPPADHRKS